MNSPYLLTASTFLLVSLGVSNTAFANNQKCIVSEKDRREFLALDVNVFDQDQNVGWRKLSKSGCKKQAAEIIKEYLLYSTEPAPVFGDRYGLLRWHAGQLYAGIDNNDEALKFFYGSFINVEAPHDKAWNAYVTATIAFMEKDKQKFITARQQLKALIEDNFDGKDIAVRNLAVINVLGDNFYKSYTQAVSNR